MRSLLVIVGFLCTTVTTVAAPVVIKSGEHGDFTRLVLYKNVTQSWSWEQNEKSGVLKIKGLQDGFDLSEVYQRIDRNRIADLSEDADSLRIAWECDCEVELSELPLGFLQIDFRNQTESNRNRTSATSKDVWGSLLLRPKSIRRFDAIDAELLDPSSQKRDAFFLGLSEEIASSSTNEFLTPNGSQAQLEAVDTASPKDRRTQLLDSLGGRAQFVDASAKKPVHPNQAENLAHELCESPQAVSLSQWGGADSFNVSLSIHRSNLLSEFDRVVDSQVMALARFYLHFDMAEEASHIIDAFGLVSEDAQFLKEYSEFLGTDLMAGKNSLIGYANCNDEAGFWGVLALLPDSDLSDVQIENAVSTFALLPKHLQKKAGPKLVAQLLHNKKDTAASLILSSASNGNARMNFEKASLPHVDKDTESPEVDLEHLLEKIDRNDDQSPFALAQYLEISNNNLMAIAPDLIELAEAYSFQLDGEHVGKRLASESIIGTVNAGFPGQALSKLKSKWQNGLSDPVQVLSRVFTKLLNDSQEVSVADLVLFAIQQNAYSELPAMLRVELAQYFNSIGQPVLAEISLVQSTDLEDRTFQRISHVIQFLNERSLDQKALNAVETSAVLPEVLARYFLVNSSSNSKHFEDLALEIDKGTLAFWLDKVDDIPLSDKRRAASELLATEGNVKTDDLRPITFAREMNTRSQTVRKSILAMLYPAG